MPSVKRATYSGRHKTLRKRLREARKRLGINQGALADRIGRPQSFVSKVESGERRLDVIEFIEYALALGLVPAALISDVT